MFEVLYDRGRRVALRLHPEGAAGLQAAIAEQRWTESLADTGFACPWPQRTLDGALVPDLPEGIVASAVQWIEAPRLSEMLRRDPSGYGARFRAIGELLADLHLTSDAVAPPDLDLPDRSLAPLCRTLSDPEGAVRGGFTAAEAETVAAACRLALPRLATLPEDWSGLIHGAIGPKRFLVDRGQLYLTGFQRGGRGLRLQDLARALLPVAGDADEPSCRAALLDGYVAAEGPLSPKAFDSLDAVLVLSALACVLEADKSEFRPRAVALARRFLSE